MSERAAIVAALALVGCGGPTCADVVDHLVASRLVPSGLAAVRRAACEQAPPSARARSCMMAATTEDEVTHCRSLDVDRAAAPAHPQADDEARLRELAHDVERYYLQHAAFPAASAGPLPPVGACCRQAPSCAGGGEMWASAPWPALGFAPAATTRASFWYEATDPAREAIVHAIFDLDCDGATGQAVIAIRVDSGTPVVGPMITSYERD